MKTGETSTVNIAHLLPPKPQIPTQIRKGGSKTRRAEEKANALKPVSMREVEGKKAANEDSVGSGETETTKEVVDKEKAKPKKTAEDVSKVPFLGLPAASILLSLYPVEFDQVAALINSLSRLTPQWSLSNIPTRQEPPVKILPVKKLPDSEPEFIPIPKPVKPINIVPPIGSERELALQKSKKNSSLGFSATAQIFQPTQRKESLGAQSEGQSRMISMFDIHEARRRASEASPSKHAWVSDHITGTDNEMDVNEHKVSNLLDVGGVPRAWEASQDIAVARIG